jgi:vacuolar-type H+-ATPase subunit H
MSGMETVKIIVDAEREAAKILQDAQNRALQIRKKIDSLIQEQRQEMLTTARKEAAAIVRRAEEEGKSEAESYEMESARETSKLVSSASSRRAPTIEKLVSLIFGSVK